MTTPRAQGLWAPMLTPLDGDLTPDVPRAVAFGKDLLDQGCHGLVVFGTTGEATSFSVAERQAVLEALLEAGIAPERMMIGTGCCALTDSVALTAHAAGLGCKQVLMLPPFYYKGPSDEGLFRAYAETIERVGDGDLALYLYHFPRLSQVPISHELIERLLAAYPDTLAGLKDSSGDAAGCTAFIRAFPDLAVFPGTETIMLAMLEAGGAGCITASANVNAPAIRALWDAFQAGSPEAKSLQEAITAVRLVLQSTPAIPTLKQVLAWRGNDEAWLTLRPPLTNLSEGQATALQTCLTDLSFELRAA